jgi:hypothetical protein
VQFSWILESAALRSVYQQYHNSIIFFAQFAPFAQVCAPQSRAHPQEESIENVQTTPEIGAMPQSAGCYAGIPSTETLLMWGKSTIFLMAIRLRFKG